MTIICNDQYFETWADKIQRRRHTPPLSWHPPTKKSQVLSEAWLPPMGYKGDLLLEGLVSAHPWKTFAGNLLPILPQTQSVSIQPSFCLSLITKQTLYVGAPLSAPSSGALQYRLLGQPHHQFWPQTGLVGPASPTTKSSRVNVPGILILCSVTQNTVSWALESITLATQVWPP